MKKAQNQFCNKKKNKVSVMFRTNYVQLNYQEKMAKLSRKSWNHNSTVLCRRCRMCCSSIQRRKEEEGKELSGVECAEFYRRNVRVLLTLLLFRRAACFDSGVRGNILAINFPSPLPPLRKTVVIFFVLYRKGGSRRKPRTLWNSDLLIKKTFVFSRF